MNINPVIFRLSVKKDWNCKFIEKKLTELSIYIFQKTEIINFINLFFKRNGLKINNLKLYYKKTLIHIFIDYNVIKILTKNIYFLNKKFNNLLNFNYNLFMFKKICFKLKQYLKNKNLKYIYKLIEIKFININLLLNKTIHIVKMVKRINLLKFIHFFKFKFKNLKENYFMNNFINKLIINLQLFLNKIKIFIIIKQINKNSNLKFLLSKQKKLKLFLKIIKLRKFEKNNKFFNIVLNLIFTFFKLKKRSLFISEILELELKHFKNFKSLNFFLKFLENSLKQFLLKFNIIKGITLILKGNLNKTARASKKIIKIGYYVNNLKINNNIDFYQFIYFTLKGTIGSKIFIKY